MATALQSIGDILAGYVHGRTTPIPSGINMDEYIKARTRLVRAYTDIGVAIANTQKEQVTAFANIRVARTQSMASTLQGIADLAKANAMSKEAAAQLADVYLKAHSAGNAAIALAEPDPSAEADLRVAMQAATSAGLGDNASAKIAEATAGGQVNVEGIRQAIEGSPAMAYVRDTAVRINQLPADSAQTYPTAMFAEAEAKRFLYSELGGQEQKLGLAPGTLTSQTDVLSESLIKPAFTGHPAMQDRAVRFQDEQARAQALVQQQHDEVLQMAKGYGAPPWLLQAIKDDVDQVGRVAKDPLTFGTNIAQMPVQPALLASQAYIKKSIEELDALRGAEDPLVAAIGKWQALPGFAQWSGAMDFPGPERAAIYAARHPEEYLGFVGMARKEPAMFDDLGLARRRMAEAGRATTVAGGPTTFLTRPIERAVGGRIPGGPAATLTPEERRTRETARRAGVPWEGPNIDAAPGDLPDEPAAAVQAREAGRGTLPVVSEGETSRQQVQSPYLVDDPASRVFMLGESAYQELGDGTIVTLKAPGGRGEGTRIEPGDPNWLPLATQLASTVPIGDLRSDEPIPTVIEPSAPINPPPAARPAAPKTTAAKRSEPEPDEDRYEGPTDDDFAEFEQEGADGR